MRACTRQPNGLVRVSSAYPLPYDVWLPAFSGKGFVRGLSPSVEATFSVNGTPEGVGMKVSATGRRYATEWGEGSAVGFHVIAYRDATATGSTYSILRKDLCATPIQEHASGVTRITLWDSGGGVSTTLASTTALMNRVNVFSGYRPLGSGSLGAAWVNGNRVALASMPIGTLSSTANPICFGGSESGGEIATPWTIMAVALWQTQLPSEVDFVCLQRNKWSLFTEKTWLYTGMGSGSWTPLEVAG